MSDKAFVDTNILIYARVPAMGDKHIAARELVQALWEDGSGVISTQVLQEFAVNFGRSFPQRVRTAELRAILADYAAWQVVINTPGSVMRALEIADRFQISFWDALIVQAAEIAGAKVLYTEDLSHGQAYGSVLAVNPFVVA